ncbi:Secreted effector protein SseJ [Smittium culicis]|uniref:Secreted effector protein SseJ n=1 Tax=Smittium culicis TaxID=133412 RepID=A0A1R1X1Q6_9FUNG|nr:Secreted effector protein SseJ [Smittium culicis]
MKFISTLSVSLFYINVVLASKPTLVVFGDEWVSSGNSNISGSTISINDGRASNGPVWSEYAGLYSGYDVINFAFPGAVSNSTFIKNCVDTNLTAPSLYDQIEAFTVNFGGKFKSSSIKNDAVIISVGLNDVIQLQNIVIKSPLKFTGYLLKSVNSIVEGVKKMKSIGYNNFIVSNLPQISRIPYFSGMNAISKLSVDLATSAVNAGLLASLKLLKASDKSYGKFYVLDNYEFANSMISGSKLLSSVGITKTGSSCFNTKTGKNDLATCSDPRKFYFYDAVNPTSMVHSFYGAMASEFLSGKNFVFNSDFVSGIIRKYKISGIYTKNSTNSYIDKNITDEIADIETSFSEALDKINEIVSKKNSL